MVGLTPRKGYKEKLPLYSGTQLKVELTPPTDEESGEEESTALLTIPTDKKKKPRMKNRSMSFRVSSNEPNPILSLPKYTSAY